MITGLIVVTAVSNKGCVPRSGKSVEDSWLILAVSLTIGFRLAIAMNGRKKERG